MLGKRQVRPDVAFRTGYWILLFLLLAVGHSNHPIDSDEGMVLHGAWSLWNGLEPYTDFFAFVTPGSFYLVYWLWELFGPHYMVAKAVAVLGVFSACVGIHLTGRLLALNGFSYIGPVVYALASFGWPLISYHTFNIVLLIWATYLCVRSLVPVSVPGIAASGLLAGISALFLQHKSAAVILATAAFLLFLWRKEKRPIWLKGFALYLLCAAAPLLILLKWPLGLLFEDLVNFPLFHYIPHARVPFWPFYPACALLLGGMALLRGAANRPASLLIVVQAALLLTALQRTDYLHVSIAMAPLMALLPCLYVRAKQQIACPVSLLPLPSQPTRQASRRLSLPVALFLSAFAFTAAVPLGIAVLRLSQTRLFQFEAEPGLIGFVHEHCSESPYLYAGPFLPGLYYETRKLAATSFGIVITGFHTPEQLAQARRELERHEPACAIIDYSIVRKFNYDLDNPVDEYIRANYRPAYGYGSALMYMRSR